MTEEHKVLTYLFAVGIRDGRTTATFNVHKLKGYRTIEVLGENREIISNDVVFSDNFEAWDVHIYQVK